ncbi:hypothetical protein D3C87_1949570 [compost metagenome]
MIYFIDHFIDQVYCMFSFFGQAYLVGTLIYRIGFDGYQAVFFQVTDGPLYRSLISAEGIGYLLLRKILMKIDRHKYR